MKSKILFNFAMFNLPAFNPLPFKVFASKMPALKMESKPHTPRRATLMWAIMMRATTCAAFGALALSTIAVAASTESGFELKDAQQQRLGLVMAPASAMHYAGEAEGSGTAIDIVPLMTIDADIAASDATLAASSANYQRTKTLHADRDNASTQALEAARAQYLADRARHDALLRQLRLSGGSALAALNTEARQRLFDRLSRGDAVLLRADFLPGTLLASVTNVQIAASDGKETPLTARVLGRTTSANPQRPGPGLLLLIESSDWLQPGRNVRVLAPLRNAAKDGVLLPLSAVLHREGALWVYVKISADRFERRRLEDAVPVTGGLFVPTGLHAGQIIVTRGAASLLAAELAPPPGAAGEGG